MTRELLTGWGRTAPSVADVITPTSESDIATHLATSHRVLARGLGRSYGDAAQLGGGLVLNNRGLDLISELDTDSGVVTVGAGVSIDELLTAFVPRGFFVPVTPGTRHVTIGGAIAADVHGKNHHVDGSISHHVRSMRIVTPSGPLTVSRENDPELFWATVGGMGLTGIITEATIQLLPIDDDRIVVDTERFSDLAAVMDAMSSRDHEYRYSVAWVDCMANGRAVLTRGRHATANDVTDPQLRAPRPARLVVPFTAPNLALNALSVRLFNEAVYRVAPKKRDGQLRPYWSYFHPLDAVREWNRMYGRRGLVQYQFVVPDRRADAIERAISRLSDEAVPSFLAVLKRFGPGNESPLSFPVAGWTLALDMPVGDERLPDVLDELDELVIDAGGRVYLAKDARLDRETFAAMYPRASAFQSVKVRVDPNGILTSDLAERVGLTGR